MSATKFEGWAIVEIMGHRRLGGMVSEVSVAGAPFLRIDVASDPAATQFYSPTAIFSITPTTEECAKAVHAPSPWEVRRLGEGIRDSEESSLGDTYDDEDEDQAVDDCPASEPDQEGSS